MKTIAICNLKGGVAKTTTVINMASILAKDYKKRVLVIDADSQCNTSEFFGAADNLFTLADILRHSDSPVGVYASNYPGIDILPGSDTLMDLDLTKVEMQSVQVNAIKMITDDPATEYAYDYCIIDCPPAFNAASAAALLAADEVIIPIKLDAFSIRGMANLMHQIANMRQINPGLTLAGLLPTMWYKSDKTQCAEQDLQKAGFTVYPHIRRTDKVDDMTYEQEPLVAFSPRSAAGVDYRRFVRGYLEGGHDNG
ncbi:MAG: ParA family protein [Oscillospiraceae bacterium]|nr:ParA family protein [Oscillospiraceae bacterium]